MSVMSSNQDDHFVMSPDRYEAANDHTESGADKGRRSLIPPLHPKRGRLCSCCGFPISFGSAL
jgi:hypothetical protein